MEKISDGYEKRVELHCHTKMGGDATMYAGEVLSYLSEQGASAVAIADTSSILAYPEMKKVWDSGRYLTRPIFGMDMLVTSLYEDGVVFNVTVLVKDEEGRCNLYNLISENDCKLAQPIYDFEKLMDNRDGLLIGSGTARLYDLAFAGHSDEFLMGVMKYYDYIEILPAMEYRVVNSRLLALASKLDMLVVAVSDAHYINKEDKLAWDALQLWNQKPICEAEHHIHTTEEMLAAFFYLGPDKAREVVITNTNKIADMCSIIDVCPMDRHSIKIEDADKIVKELCNSNIEKLYPSAIKREVEKRLEFELNALKQTDMSSIVLVVKKLMDKLNLNACDISCRGVAAGSMVLYLLGVSEIDPIEYRLEPELIFGINGNNEIDIDINVPEELREKAGETLETMDCIDKAVIAGAYSSVRESLAKKMLLDYEKTVGIELPLEMREKLVYKLDGNFVKRSKHPGGIILFPKGKTKGIPFANAPDGSKTTYFVYHSMDYCYIKLDLLANREINMLKHLSDETHVPLDTIPLDDEKVFGLFQKQENGRIPACDKIPAFHNDFIRNLVERLEPKNFESLVRILSLAHGTSTWEGNGSKLLENDDVSLGDLITNRDDIFNYLSGKGIARDDAFHIAEDVRKGIIARAKPARWNDWKLLLKDAGVPDWYLWSCEQIRYLFPRAHTISYVIMSLRLGWFYVNYPDLYLDELYNSTEV